MSLSFLRAAKDNYLNIIKYLQFIKKKREKRRFIPDFLRSFRKKAAFGLAATNGIASL